MRERRLGNVLHHVRTLAAGPQAEGLSDPELLERFARCRDEAAFEALVKRHGQMVLGVCRRVLRHTQDAEDACQATFLVLARKAATLRQGEALGSWLYRVAHHIALKARGVVARRTAGEVPAAKPQADATEEVSWREALAVLDQELARLPAGYRAALVLCYLEGRTQDEAARQLGWSLGTLRGQLERGRAKLRARLLRRGIGLPVTLLGVVLGQGEGSAVSASTIVTAARHFATGDPAGVSARVAAWAEHGARGMVSGNIKLALVLVLAIGVLTAALGLAAHREGPPNEPVADQPVVLPHKDSRNPKTKEAAGVDRHGDSLPPGALARFGTLRLVQGGRAHHMALSSDGKLLAAGDEHGRVRVWDTVSGKELRTFECKEFIGAVAFVPARAGLRVAAGTNTGRLRVWELESGKLVLEANYPRQAVRGGGAFWKGVFSLTASADGNLLAVGADDRIHLWDLAAGKERRHWFAHRGGATSLAFTPDGKGLLSGGRNHEPISGSLVVGPMRPDDGYALALWELATGKLRKKFAEQKTEARVLGFTADGRSWGSLGSGSAGSEFRLWDSKLRTRALVSLKGLQYTIGGAALSPDGKTLAIAYSQTLELWDIPSGKRLRTLKDEGEYYTFALAFLPDGRTLVASPGNTRVRFWDLATGKPRHTFEAHERSVQALAIAPGGKTAVTGGPDGQVREWDIATGKPLRDFRFEDQRPRYLVALRYAPDGKTLACAYFGGITLWDTASSERLRTIPAPPSLSRIISMHFSPDGTKLVYQGIDDPVLRLWDLRLGKEVRQLPQGKGGTYFLACSPWEERIASTVTARLSLWDAVTGKEVYRKKLSAHELTFSPDGLLLGMYSEPTRILEAGSGEELVQIPHRAHHGGSWSLAFSPDGRYLAVTELDNIGIWDVLAGKFVHTFRGHRGWTTSLAFTPDGSRLISGAEDMTALVWDMSVVPEAKLPAPDWASLWGALKETDRRVAYTAFWHMRRAPAKAVALLEQHLRPVLAIDPGRLERLLKDLEAPVFAVREKATEELLRLADSDAVAKRLQEYAKEPLALEVRRRLARVLPKVGGSLETRRLLWSLRLLEMIGTNEARALLRRMTEGDPASPVTRQARAALARQDRTSMR
jgi:RNA polymerase sigma factor (sigma-70 family)